MKTETGKYAGFNGDRNDCSIRAAAVAGNLPYADVSAMFAKHGRKPNRGTKTRVSVAAHRELFDAERVPIPRISLAEFARRFPTGRYVVHVRGHALAVCDGVIHDWRPALRRMARAYWKVEPKSAQPDIEQKIIAALEEQNRLLAKLAEVK